jgi:hypothetical protein
MLVSSRPARWPSYLDLKAIAFSDGFALHHPFVGSSAAGLGDQPRLARSG